MTGLRTIWKFEIQVEDAFTLEMPAGAQVIHVAVQGNIPQLWALLDPAAEREERTFYVHGTGHAVQPGRSHLGSFQLLGGSFVGHLFE